MPKEPTYPENTRSVLMTNVNGTGDDVMVFTTLTAAELQRCYLLTQKIGFEECYEVPEKDVGFYLYEPCWLTLAEEAFARNLLAQNPEPANAAHLTTTPA